MKQAKSEASSSPSIFEGRALPKSAKFRSANEVYIAAVVAAIPIPQSTSLETPPSHPIHRRNNEDPVLTQAILRA